MIKFLGLILVLMSSCSGYDDYYYPTRYESQQVVKYKNESIIIKEIEYPDAELIDYPENNVSKLRVSPLKPTKFIVKSDMSTDTFEVTMEFGDLKKDFESEYPAYHLPLKNVVLSYSSRPNAKLERYQLYKESTWAYSTTYLLIDSLIIQ
ncbi:MAG: hypothetical protein MH472_08225 [Bacteroidia bacterium]|nr:hypothetical protein [Bacteroidia bacterium]